jgi:cytochrome c biogenesis protein CcdA
MSLIFPFLKGLKKGARNFGETISIIANSLLLLLVYLIGVGLTSLIAKLAGKKFLEAAPSKKQKSYWSALGLKTRPIEEHYRQF